MTSLNNHNTIVETPTEAATKDGRAFRTKFTSLAIPSGNKRYFLVETLDNILSLYPSITSTAGPLYYKRYILPDFTIGTQGSLVPARPLNVTKSTISPQVIIREIDEAQVTITGEYDDLTLVPATEGAGNRPSGESISPNITTILPPNSVFLFEVESLTQSANTDFQAVFIHITDNTNTTPTNTPTYVDPVV